MEWIFGLFLFNSVFMLIIAIREVRRPAVALNWLTINFIFPVIGFVFYLITSNPPRINSGKRLPSPHNKSDTLPDSFGRSAQVIAQALKYLTVEGIRYGQVQVLINGIKTFDKLMESIQNAKKTIDLEYYIYRDDQIGNRITDLLIERALNGVHIRFIRDGWGSKKLSKTQILRMMDAGIECRTIFPLRFPWIFSTLNNRDHCKIVVIDNMEAFTGGINVGDEYTGLKPDVGYWRDTHVRIVGEASVDLQRIFEAHWNIASLEHMRKRSRMKTKTENKSSLITPSTSPNLSSMMTEWSSELGTIDSTDANSVRTSKKIHEAYVQTFEGNPEIPTPVIREAIFFEKVTGTKRDRPELNRMLEFLRPEDTVVVTDLTRLSRSTKDLIEITELIAQKGAHLKSLKESWLDTTTAHGKMLFTIFAGIAQFERDLTSERTKEGILAAKKRGKFPGRPKADEEKINYALYLIDQGMSRTDAAEKAGISRMTLYRKLQREEKS